MKSNQNTSKLFCGYQQSDSKVYTERQQTQNRQLDIKVEQSQKTGTAWLQALLQSYSNQDSVIVTWN